MAINTGSLKQELSCQKYGSKLRNRFSVLNGIEVVNESDIGHEEGQQIYNGRNGSSTVVETGEKIVSFKRGYTKELGISKETWQVIDEWKLLKHRIEQTNTKGVGQQEMEM